ncbi:MAG: type II secretion system F family protein [Acidobacteria bacterium]|nr:type II secretion system F family protein [Acidobacteriota bacterium]
MLAFVTVGIFLVMLTAAGLLAWRFVGAPQAAAAPAAGDVDDERPRWAGALADLADVSPAVDEGQLRRQLYAAGFRQPWAAAAYRGARTATTIALPTLGFGAVIAFTGQVFPALLTAALGAALGYRLPERYLRGRTRARRQALNRALPDFLDLLVIGVESGLSLDQAISDTSRDLRRVHPVLWDELNLFRSELIAGATRAEALRNLGQRCGEPELRKLTSLLIQADRFGSSVSKVLRTQARYMRVRRRQAAEEKAHKVGVKLLFPIFFLIMPSVFLITAGPAVIMLLENFGRMASGR